MVRGGGMSGILWAWRSGGYFFRCLGARFGGCGRGLTSFSRFCGASVLYHCTRFREYFYVVSGDVLGATWHATWACVV